MSEDHGPQNPSSADGTGMPRRIMDDDIKHSLQSVGDFIERALEHHARSGEWPPDPLLDEVDEMRQQVMARHGNDPRKVLEWYVERGHEQVLANSSSSHPESPDRSAGVRGR